MFKIKSEERILTIILLIVFLFINAIYIYNFYGVFWPKISGYDPWVHGIITDWFQAPYVYQDSFTHSLFALLLLPLYFLNIFCTHLFGVNCADYILGMVLVFNSLYSFIFLKRIFSEIVGVSDGDSILLSTLFFSFAYIMLMIVVPEHFPFSMFMMITTLYVSGKKIRNKRHFYNWEIIILYCITAGITITNGIKVFFAYFVVNGTKTFFSKIIKLFVIPLFFMCLVALIIAQLSKNKPMGMAILSSKYEESTKSLKSEVDTSKVLLFSRDLVEIDDRIHSLNNSTTNSTGNLLSIYRRVILYNSSHHSFIKVITCNFFGESFQFHRKGFLNDRMIYGLYKNPINHIVQFTLLFMALWGLILGWKDKFLRLCLSFFAFDFTLHIIFGFAFSEVYIMTPHWAFFIPICIGYLFKYGKNLKLIRTVAIILTAFLLSYNGFLLIRYFY